MKEVKGGTFAKADMQLVKDSLIHFAKTCSNHAEAKKIANLLHRLGRISS